ncbi:putative disease resistance protein At3g15700 [Chenopodium quinoa]|uniref:putative disease resistance protein At3g15700 n=1 Tax=Chenopodium quinoa TaxID=63459 RepID=UPI000B77DAF8|nr:putative disease resistance protein At3g15700 [Chenopodium quinoa]
MIPMIHFTFVFLAFICIFFVLFLMVFLVPLLLVTSRLFRRYCFESPSITDETESLKDEFEFLINLMGCGFLVPLLLATSSLFRRYCIELPSITDETESLKDVWEFLINLSRWFYFYKNHNANVQELKYKRNMLWGRRNDLINRVEHEESKTGRTRKEEVDAWLNHADLKITDLDQWLEHIKRETTRYKYWKFLYHAWLGNLLELKNQEVEELHDRGDFKEVLVRVSKKVEYATTPLVGIAVNLHINTVLEWLARGSSHIGLYGIKGIGKTAVMMHIYNELLRGEANVYMIQVHEDDTEFDLQGEIAKALDINFQEENKLKRTALLYDALMKHKRNIVLILDGLSQPLWEEEVGIPLDWIRGQLIITSRSLSVCRRSGCRAIIEMDRLQENEALELFKQKLKLASELEPPVQDVAGEIVRRCWGVPGKIVDKARELRGVDDDIRVWKENLNDMIDAVRCRIPNSDLTGMTRNQQVIRMSLDRTRVRSAPSISLSLPSHSSSGTRVFGVGSASRIFIK